MAGQIAGENNVGLALGNRSGQLQKKGTNRKAAGALVGRIFVLIAGRIIELFARGVNKDGILSSLAKINLRPRELKRRRLDLRRSVLDEQDGQAVGRNLVDLGHHHTKAVRIDEMRIDPALAGFGRQLAYIDFARRQQHLLDVAVDEIAVNVGVRESVVRAQRLNLRDGCVVGAQVPQPGIRQQGCVLHRIDHALAGRREWFFGGVAVEAEGSGGRLNMALNVGPFDGDLIRPHVDGANDSRQRRLQNKTGQHQDNGLLELRQPHQRQRREGGNNQEPAQRQVIFSST